jgi:hypothetical protein
MFRKLLIKISKGNTIKELLNIYGTVDQIPDWRLKHLGLSRNDLESFSGGNFEKVQKEQRNKNFQETGIRETDPERKSREGDIKIKEQQKEELKRLTSKYGSPWASLIQKGKLKEGMTKQMVIASKGNPSKKIEKVSRGKVREEYFYGAYKNRKKNTSYKFRVVLIDGKVDGWNDITK